jgi:hypothetical protein
MHRGNRADASFYRILALYHHFAVLVTASPLLKNDPNLWQHMIADTIGYTLLTRARDAAVEIIRAICLVSAPLHFHQIVLIYIPPAARGQAYSAIVSSICTARDSN